MKHDLEREMEREGRDDSQLIFKYLDENEDDDQCFVGRNSFGYKAMPC
jgi:hypothetical protein